MADSPEPSRPALDEAKRGSAELLILALVEGDDHHGYDIARQIELRSNGTLRFTLASLYATLYRIEARGWIRPPPSEQRVQQESAQKNGGK